MSIEQIVREVLTAAIEADVVSLNRQWRLPEPACRTAGELVGPANKLAELLPKIRCRRCLEEVKP